MKFKFRADADDVKKFLLYCGGILYLVCIAILNVNCLYENGSLYGVIPFEAFTLRFLPTTLTLFALAVVGIIAATGSKFYDREKGFGFQEGKKVKEGYARWAKEKEMMKCLKKIDPTADTVEYGGIALINNAKSGMWVDAGEDHMLVMGSTGSGKTVMVSKPMIKILGKKGESMIITDPKGELYENCGNMLKEKGYNIVVLNFRDPQFGNAWNPMALPYRYYQEGDTDKSTELLDDLALNILYEEKAGGNADPFWEKAGADYFSGLVLGLFEDADNENQVNLNSLNLMSVLGEEKYGRSNYIKEYFNMKDPSRPAYISASGTVYAPEDTKGGVLATFKQKVKLFSSRDNLSEMLSHSDFDMKDIGRKKTAVFMIIQDEKKTLHPLATIFIKQCYETLIDVAHANGGKLAYRTNFILDEFANMPPLKDVTTMVTAARSRAIKFTFIIQNFAQLVQVYGKENAETIKGNCSTVYLLSSELTALEELSKRCGEIKSKEKEKTASRPLVTVSDLQRLPQWTIVVLKNRMMPFKTKFIPDFKMNWGKTYDKCELVERPRQQVELFDIREFVKNKKKDETPTLDNPMGGFGMPGMMGGGIPNNFGLPFGGGIGAKADNGPANFNIDEMMKKIDLKIAALEEEERLEKEKTKDADILPISEKLDVNQFSKKSVEEKKDDEFDKKYSDETSDDQFFDDFFFDEI
ncbi:MAG: type IV secretory system conjugative DNA transfer family protein [bacterium]|nr:type IV secretory system conjugative DNA transfer family protein [bacterium]